MEGGKDEKSMWSLHAKVLELLQSCQTEDGYKKILEKIEHYCKEDPEYNSSIRAALEHNQPMHEMKPNDLAHVLSEIIIPPKGPVKLENTQATAGAHTLKEFSDRFAAFSPVPNISLDADSIQSMKRELRRTYNDNSISALAAEGDIGLEDPRSNVAKQDPLVSQQEIFVVPAAQKTVIGLKEANDLHAHSPIFSNAEVRKSGVEGGEPCSAISGLHTPSKLGSSGILPNVQIAAFREEKRKESGNEDDEDESSEEMQEKGKGEEIKECAARSSRGLRALSVRVRELVFEKVSTTYKEVADELIKEFVEGGRMPRDSYHSKDEKNVRRRVYDALNVLIAAGIIQKNGKSVQYDPRPQYQQESQGNNEKEVSDQLEQIKDEVARIREESIRKKKLIKDLKLKKRSVKILLKRNEQMKRECVVYRPEEVIKFPFIVLATQNSAENGIALRISEDQRKIQIGFKKPFTLFGDIDALLQLKMNAIAPGPA